MQDALKQLNTISLEETARAFGSEKYNNMIQMNNNIVVNIDDDSLVRAYYVPIYFEGEKIQEHTKNYVNLINTLLEEEWLLPFKLTPLLYFTLINIGSTDRYHFFQFIGAKNDVDDKKLKERIKELTENNESFHEYRYSGFDITNY